MGKKNWIEFDNQEKKSEETVKVDTFNKRSKINISKQKKGKKGKTITLIRGCLLYTSPSPRDGLLSRMPSSA